MVKYYFNMDKSQIEQARKVIRNLKEHPLCFSSKDDSENSFRHFENKLNDGKYSNFKNFIQELIERISSQFGNDSDNVYSQCREFSLNVVQKELNKAFLYDADTWSKLIIKYNDRYKYTLQSLNNKKQKSLSISDLQSFITATEYLKDEKSVQDMIQIIKSREPKQNLEKSNINIDMTKLQAPTIIALIDFAKDSLSKRNIPYPS